MNSIFTFAGHSFDSQSGTAIFSYQLHYENHNIAFLETLQFPIEQINKKQLESLLVKNILDQLLLILGISYWKTTCATTIEIPTIFLTKEQAMFWNTVYTKGLGEFFYKNNIDYHNLVQFPFIDKKSSPAKGESVGLQNRSLLFFGGGKDSLVSAELLKKNNKPFSLFMVNDSPIQKKTAETVHKETIIIQRTLDPKLFELNKQKGLYNGHIPISSVWAFIGLLAATLYDYQYIITSNEHSANYGNVQYLGEEINHQWSKSREFEVLFQQYVHDYVTPGITYFSLLQPLHEMKIAEIFSHYSQYFPYFSSCNRNFKIQNALTGKNWCGECPKCVFVFILLSAFLPKETLKNIFGKNIFDDISLLPAVKELLGVAAFKPFECVGTPEETKLAMFYAYKKGEFKNSIIMQFFEKEILSTSTLDITRLEKEVLSIQTNNQMPKEFKDIIRNET